MAIKKTLLQIVQSILNDMDSEDVNSIDDSVEAGQVASIVEDVFYEMAATREIPEHKGLLKLTAAADTDTPTHFSYPTNVKGIECVWYDTSDDGSLEYEEIKYIAPLEFLALVDPRSSNYDSVLDLNGGTTLRITNNAHPTYYTSFDDENIVMDAYKSTVDTTLQESKVRAYGSTIPTFSQTNSYVPDLDAEYFPYLISEAKSRCFDVFKGGTTAKIDQSSRRQRAHMQNDRFRTRMGNDRPHYGR